MTWDRERLHQSELVTAAIFWLCDGDVNRSIIEGASFGRDCDTIAKLCGNLAGALRGASDIHQHWIEQSEQANRPFFEELEGDPDANFERMAHRLVDVVQAERDRHQNRVDALDELISG